MGLGLEFESGLCSLDGVHVASASIHPFYPNLNLKPPNPNANPNPDPNLSSLDGVCRHVHRVLGVKPGRLGVLHSEGYGVRRGLELGGRTTY